MKIWTRVLAALAAAATVASCASIPRQGPAVEAADAGGLGQSTVLYSPALPADGATPVDIVRGFLDAMLAYPQSNRTAAAFLSDDAANDWQPQAGLTVYETPRVAAQAGSSAPDSAESITVTIDETGRLDARGRFARSDRENELELNLQQFDGQWRITNPPDGLFITQSYFADYYRAFNLYFFDRSGTRLAAQPVHLPVDDRLSAALVANLAAGPDAENLQSYLPDVENVRPSVPVDAGVADVGFEPGSVDQDSYERLSAQVVWTLRQVPELVGVRIAIDGDLQAADAGAIQAMTAWGRYDRTDVLDQVYAVTSDQVMTVTNNELKPVEGFWGESAQDAEAAVMSESAIALTSGNRSQAWVSDSEGTDQLTLEGNDFLNPVVDTDGAFWFVDESGGQTRIRVASSDEVATVPSPGLESLDVRSFALSPTGMRYAVTVGTGDGSELLTGWIDRADDGAISLLPPTLVPLDVADLESVVWTDATRVGFLGRGEAGVQYHSVLIDGSNLNDGGLGGRASMPQIEPAQLVVADGAEPDVYVVSEEGALWHLSPGGAWIRITTDDPVRSIGRGW